MAITAEQIHEIHRLHYGEQWSRRRIARQLGLGRETVSKYLQAPWRPKARRPRASQLDGFKPAIAELLARDAEASAVVIRQRLQALGYRGGITILRMYLQTRRERVKPRRAYVRVEVSAGARCDVDRGHFGSLDYGGHRRKLYAFVLVEGHSRKMYLEFTHGQNFETFARCHVQAFQFFGGIPGREIWYDNLATAVAEHDGRLVRFQPRFLAFARELDFCPRACNRGAGWEKGKVERAIGYVRQSFWPLRRFTDLPDVNRQAREWLVQTANCRIHRETGQRPVERFEPSALRPLPEPLPECRETACPLVHKDIRLQFDGNRYCVPPRYVGLRLDLKADARTVAIYHRTREVAVYPRCWGHGQTFGAEKYERELLERLPGAEVSHRQKQLIRWLGPDVEEYLQKCAEHQRAVPRQIRELLQLVRDYGPDAVQQALAAAAAVRAFGADYVAGILRQQAAPRESQPPVPLKDPALRQLATEPLSLPEYDALILEHRNQS